MESINYLLVFIEGILSFISPCILPIIPVYLTILANSGIEELESGEATYKNRVLLKNTVLFMLGISTMFFILGASMSVLSRFLFVNKSLLLFVGGVLIILMGIFYMGYLKIPFLQRERKFHMQVNEMKPWTAYLLGFTFSFGWTPCIGPMLASVFIMASGSESTLVGNVLIAIYSIGFMMPFLLIVLFYKHVLKLFTKMKLHMNQIQKFGGIILIISGVIMVLSGAEDVRGRLGQLVEGNQSQVEENMSLTDQSEVRDKDAGKISNAGKIGNVKEEVLEQEEVAEVIPPAPDFTLLDQYGETHTLSEYKGKTVFLNFWATWCPPCKAEMPYIEELYSEYGYNEEEVVILGVAMPNQGKEGTTEEITAFLETEGYTFPVVFDETGILSQQYYIRAFPTTFIINPEGTPELYVPGGMDKKTMQIIIEDTLEKYRY